MAVMQFETLAWKIAIFGRILCHHWLILYHIITNVVQCECIRWCYIRSRWVGFLSWFVMESIWGRCDDGNKYGRRENEFSTSRQVEDMEYELRYFYAYNI